jgi:hypothetical protein
MLISQQSQADFLSRTKFALPSLIETLNKQESSIYLIGVGAFELYAENGWCSELSRSTQDLDFSFEVIGDEKS